MSFSRRASHRPLSQINVVPYIDVMLVLLVIFMVTAPMMNPGQIELPRVGKTLAGAQHVMPRRAMELINDKLGGGSVFLDDVDQAQRQAYEERARHS